MIEILFGKSEAASMKAAKSRVTIVHADGPMAVFCAGKKKAPEREHCGWVEGMADEVICLDFALDEGRLKERIAEIETLCPEELLRLQEYLLDGEEIRIWYSNAPYALCGFYHLCSMLQKCENEVWAVRLPEASVYADHTVSYTNWGEVAPEEFAGFLPKAEIVPVQELRRYAVLWQELVEEGSPLRAVVNGRVVGVPEDFYDFLIWKRLTRTPIKEARLIGDILGYYPIGVGDAWYAGRINRLIAEGKICVLEDEFQREYARVICANDEP